MNGAPYLHPSPGSTPPSPAAGAGAGRRPGATFSIPSQPAPEARIPVPALLLGVHPLSLSEPQGPYQSRKARGSSPKDCCESELFETIRAKPSHGAWGTR